MPPPPARQDQRGVGRKQRACGGEVGSLQWGALESSSATAKGEFGVLLQQNPNYGISQSVS